MATEIVNIYHPDVKADRLAGAIVDLAYQREAYPKVAVEVLVGHGLATVIIESSVKFTPKDIKPLVERILGEGWTLKLICDPQDKYLAKNQESGIRTGDNGVYKGAPLTQEQITLREITNFISDLYPTDGKYIFDEKLGKLIVCQSNCNSDELKKTLQIRYPKYDIVVNPIGEWEESKLLITDSGCTNRKLGVNMGQDAVNGSGLHGKDFSKGDLSINVYLFLEAQRTGKIQKAYCQIGDTYVNVNGNKVEFSTIVEKAREYIENTGGFEQFACQSFV